MKLKFRYSLILMIMVLACQDVSKELNSIQPNSLQEVFGIFWNKMNSGYVYWEIDTTNWDGVYNKYLPLFKQMDINNPDHVRKSVVYLNQICEHLVDSHYSISFTNPLIKDSSVFPSLSRKLKSNTFHAPFIYTSIDSTYLDNDFIFGKHSTLDNQSVSVMSGTINNEILYFSCDRFALREAYYTPQTNQIKSCLNYFFSQLNNNHKGIILDLRGNQGGNIEDLDFLIGSLVAQSINFGYTRHKNGSGRLDFTPWIEANISSRNSKERPPITVLADNFSASLAETAVMALKVIPDTKFIGEVTWGASGPITDEQVYNDGQFKVENFMTVITSSVEFRYVDFKSYEGIGFPPDIAIPFNLTTLLNGVDEALEKAIKSFD